MQSHKDSQVKNRPEMLFWNRIITTSTNQHQKGDHGESRFLFFCYPGILHMYVAALSVGLCDQLLCLRIVVTAVCCSKQLVHLPLHDNCLVEKPHYTKRETWMCTWRRKTWISKSIFQFGSLCLLPNWQNQIIQIFRKTWIHFMNLKLLYISTIYSRLP
jgi:hypothetical protein